MLDADDTLWENNIYYEQVVSGYLELLERFSVSREAARARLNQIEQANIPVRGYGSMNFLLSLEEAFLSLLGPELGASHLVELKLLGRILTDRSRPVLLRPGVAETLPELARRHKLILLTKGDRDEQLDKLDRSGLASFFHSAEVTAEKNTQTYLELVARYRLESSATWMVGNSPRSDINPALSAGLGAVLIPHPVTWEFEMEPLLDEERVIVLESFGQLLTLF